MLLAMLFLFMLMRARIIGSQCASMVASYQALIVAILLCSTLKRTERGIDVSRQDTL